MKLIYMKLDIGDIEKGEKENAKKHRETRYRKQKRKRGPYIPDVEI